MNQEEDWIIVNSRDLITKQIENEHKLKKLKPSELIDLMSLLEQLEKLKNKDEESNIRQKIENILNPPSNCPIMFKSKKSTTKSVKKSTTKSTTKSKKKSKKKSTTKSTKKKNK